jgi:PAS domain S-box-containing protein
MDSVDNALLKVLLVEDDEDDYVIIRDLLSEMERFELEWVTDYDDALGAMEREEHDVCLLDYRLGERSGLSCCAKLWEGLQSSDHLAHRSGRPRSRPGAMQAGAADYLIKGQIDAPLLERSIRYALPRTLRILGESEKRFRSLVQNGSDIITILDAEGTIQYQSPSIERLLGYSTEDLVGQNAFDYVHPDDLERVRSIFGEITKRSGASGPVEVRFRHADGSWRYLEWIANNLLEDPTVRG